MSQAGEISFTSSGNIPTSFTTNAGVAVPVANNLNIFGGTGVTVSGAGSTVTITVAASGFTIVDVTGTTQAMSVETTYFANNVGLVTLTLPATATEGDIIKVRGKGSGGWKIAQNALQQIHFGNQATTIGVGGSLASTNQWDNLVIEATNTSSSTIWTVTASQGNITVV